MASILNKETLTLALSQSLNAFALPHDRKSAEAYLQQIKNTDTQDVFMLLIEYLCSTSENYDNSISMNQYEGNSQLVLSLLSEWIQTWWNNFNTDNHIFIRTTIIQQVLLNTNIHRLLIKSKAMRNKLAVILSNIAKRQYPQQWETFITDMTELWLKTSPNELQEIFMMTVDITVTDCINPDFSSSLPMLRKQDILTALKKDLEPFLQISSQYLQYCMKEYFSYVAINPNQKNTSLINSIIVLLNMLSPIFTYLKTDEIFRIQPDLFNIISLIAILDFQACAVDILAIFTCHKLNNFDAFHHILTLVCSHPLTLSASLPSVEVSRMYELSTILTIQSTYAQAILSLLSYNVAYLLTSTYPPRVSSVTGETVNIDALRLRFFELLASVTLYPSLRLAYDLLTNWTMVFHDMELSNLASLKPLCQILLQSALNKSVKAVWQKSVTNSGSNEWSVVNDAVVEEEFESYEEYNEFLGNYKSQLRPLLLALLRKYPLEVTMEMTQRLEYLLLQESGNSSNYMPVSLLSPSSPISSSTSLQQQGQNVSVIPIQQGFVLISSSLLLRGLESLFAAVEELIKYLLSQYQLQQQTYSQLQAQIQSHTQQQQSPSQQVAVNDNAANITNNHKYQLQQQIEAINIYNQLLNLVWRVFDLFLEAWQVIVDPHLMKWRIRYLLSFGPLLAIEDQLQQHIQLAQQQQSQQLMSSSSGRIEKLLTMLFSHLTFEIPPHRLEFLTTALSNSSNSNSSSSKNNNFSSGKSFQSASTSSNETATTVKKCIEELMEECVIVRRRVAAAIPQLAGSCAQVIIKSSFYNPFVIQISTLIADNQNGLLAGQRGSLRESLVVLSENIGQDENANNNQQQAKVVAQQRNELLSMALESVVNDWMNYSTQLFATPSSLIEAVQSHVFYNNNKNLLQSSQQQVQLQQLLSQGQLTQTSVAPSLLAEIVDNQNANSGNNLIVQIKSIFNTILAITKRITIPNFVDKLWIELIDTIDMNNLATIFPFALIWRMILPGIQTALNTLHTIWLPEFRIQVLNSTEIDGNEIYSLTPAAMTSIGLSNIELTDVASAVAASGESGGSGGNVTVSGSGTSDTFTLGTILTLLRRLIYQVLGFCCTQYVFYFFPEHNMIIQNFAENIINMENTHLAVMMNQFVVKYIMNAPPTKYETVSKFLEILFTQVQIRLLIAWNNNDNRMIGSSNNSDNSNNGQDLARSSLKSTKSITNSISSSTDSSASYSSYASSSSSSSSSPLDIFYANIYKHCSISKQILSSANSNTYGSNNIAITAAQQIVISPEVIEVVKERIIMNLNRCYADLLAIVICCQGPLLDITSSTTTSSGDGGSGENSSAQLNTSAAVASIGSTKSKSKKSKNKQIIQQTGTNDNTVTATSGVGSSDDDYNNASIMSSESTQAQNNIIEIRRKYLLGLLFNQQNSRILKAYLQSVITLIFLPDGGCVRKAIAISYVLLKASIQDTRLQRVVGRELFSALIAVVSEEKKAIVGLEWDLVDLAQSIYSLYVLGISLSTTATATSSAGSSDISFKMISSTAASSTKENIINNNTMSGSSESEQQQLQQQVQLLYNQRQAGVEETGAMNPFPRQVLIEIPDMTPQRVFQLEYQLLQNPTNKKKRRDIFKDFLAELIHLFQQQKQQSLEFASHQQLQGVLGQNSSQLLPNSPEPLYRSVDDTSGGNAGYGSQNADSIFFNGQRSGGGNSSGTNQQSVSSSILNIQTRVLRVKPVLSPNAAPALEQVDFTLSSLFDE